MRKRSVTDGDRYQVYIHSVRRERGEDNRRADITKTGELIKSLIDIFIPFRSKPVADRSGFSIARGQSTRGIVKSLEYL